MQYNLNLLTLHIV